MKLLIKYLPKPLLALLLLLPQCGSEWQGFVLRKRILEMRDSDAKCTAAPMNRWGIGSYRNKRQHGYRTHSIKSMLRHSPARLKKLTGFDAKSIDWIHKLIVCKWSVGRVCVSVGVCVFVFGGHRRKCAGKRLIPGFFPLCLCVEGFDWWFTAGGWFEFQHVALSFRFEVRALHETAERNCPASYTRSDSIVKTGGLINVRYGRELCDSKKTPHETDRTCKWVRILVLIKSAHMRSSKLWQDVGSSGCARRTCYFFRGFGLLCSTQSHQTVAQLLHKPTCTTMSYERDTSMPE